MATQGIPPSSEFNPPAALAGLFSQFPWWYVLILLALIGLIAWTFRDKNDGTY